MSSIPYMCAVVQAMNGRLVVAGRGDVASMPGASVSLRREFSGPGEYELHMRALIRALTGTPNPAGEQYIAVEAGTGNTFGQVMAALTSVVTNVMANATPEQPADLTGVQRALSGQGYQVSGVQVATGVWRTLPKRDQDSGAYAVLSGFLEELLLGHVSLTPPTQ